MLNVNQVVTVSGYLAVITATYKDHVELTVNFQGKVIKNVIVAKSEVTLVAEKAKYTKDAQFNMFGRVFSLGFISISLTNLNFENVWDLSGECIRIMTAKKINMIAMV